MGREREGGRETGEIELYLSHSMEVCSMGM